MWEFPNGRVNGDPAKELPSALKTGYKLRLGGTRKKEALGVVQHAYTHFKVTVYVFQCELISISKETNIKWVSLNKLQDYPMGKIDRQIAEMIAKKSGRIEKI
jgi:A/G-specific adenine glycosylase